MFTSTEKTTETPSFQTETFFLHDELSVGLGPDVFSGKGTRGGRAGTRGRGLTGGRRGGWGRRGVVRVCRVSSRPRVRVDFVQGGEKTTY